MELFYKKARYSVDDTLAITTWWNGDGYLEPYGDVTVNVRAYYNFPLDDSLVILPKYKMSEEYYDQIIDDIVERELSTVQIGYGEGVMVKLKENWEQLVKMLPEN